MLRAAFVLLSVVLLAPSQVPLLPGRVPQPRFPGVRTRPYFHRESFIGLNANALPSAQGSVTSSESGLTSDSSAAGAGQPFVYISRAPVLNNGEYEAAMDLKLAEPGGVYR